MAGGSSGNGIWGEDVGSRMARLEERVEHFSEQQRAHYVTSQENHREIKRMFEDFKEDFAEKVDEAEKQIERMRNNFRWIHAIWASVSGFVIVVVEVIHRWT